MWVRRVAARAVDELLMLAVQCAAVFGAAFIVGISQLGDDSVDRDAAVLAAAVVISGWLACVVYEIGCTRGGVSLGKATFHLRVLDASTGRRPTGTQAFVRWLLVVGVQPLIWLVGPLGAQESPEARATIVVVLAVSLLWRAALAVSVLATGGRGGVHDRLAHTQVVVTAPVAPVRSARRAGSSPRVASGTPS